MTSDAVRYPRASAPADVMAAAAGYEQRFGGVFDSLHYFPRAFLEGLHAAPTDGRRLVGDVEISSDHDPGIAAEIDALGRVANAAEVQLAERSSFFEGLKRVYARLSRRPDEGCADPGTLCIGIQREGAKLARALHWLPEGRSLTPNAKRIPFEGGLVVGVSQLPVLRRYDCCVIVDGAIASGATIMSVIQELCSVVPEFQIYSVHASFEGLRAIARFGERCGVQVRITVGHATAGMNDHYYAVDPADPRRLVVGDLGDTISELPDEG